MATKKYVWNFDLEENMLTKDVKEDFVGKVKPIQTFTMQDVARFIAEERTEYRTDTIVNIMGLVEAKIRQLACQNNVVLTDNVQFMPTVSGVFMGETGVVDPEKQKGVVNLIATNKMRAETEQISLEFSGRIRRLGGANIGLVRDITTGKTDGTITPGGMVEVTGSKIRCVGADGVSLGSIKLVSMGEQSVAGTITVLGINDPSRLMFNLPANLAAGEYQLIIETWFSSTSTLLKEARTLVYIHPLVVVSQ